MDAVTDHRYDERTGLFMPQMLHVPAPKMPELTREQKIKWALAYLRERFKS